MNVLDRLDTTLRVVGGARLEGSVEVQGAKNAALPIMAATLLARGKVTLHRVPRITDVSVMWSLLEALGARLSLESRNTITIDSSNVNRHRAPYALVRKLAASFDLCGPLLGRFGRAEVPLPHQDGRQFGGRVEGASVALRHDKGRHIVPIIRPCHVYEKGRPLPPGDAGRLQIEEQRRDLRLRIGLTECEVEMRSKPAGISPRARARASPSGTAAVLAGINVRVVTVALYMLSGLFSALGGIVLVAYGGQATLGMGDP